MEQSNHKRFMRAESKRHDYRLENMDNQVAIGVEYFL